MKRPAIILWISAVVLLTLSITAEAVKVEQSTWETIDIRSLLTVLVCIMFCGLVLGIILFRKRKFKERIAITIPIAMMAFSLFTLLVILDHSFGLTDKYNYFTAQRDLRNGKVHLIVKGFVLPESAAKQAVRKQFGYDIIWDGCSVMNGGYQKYNAVMEQYLQKVNGAGWQARQQRILDGVR